MCNANNIKVIKTFSAYAETDDNEKHFGKFAYNCKQSLFKIKSQNETLH